MTNEEAAWMAGIIDGEGCLYIHKTKARKEGYSNWFQVVIRVKMCHKPTIERLNSLFPGRFYKENPGKLNRRMAWKWEVNSSNVPKLLNIILPFLFTKKEEAETLLEFFDSKTETVTKRLGVSKEENALRESFYIKVRELKKKEWKK